MKSAPRIGQSWMGMGRLVAVSLLALAATACGGSSDSGTVADNSSATTTAAVATTTPAAAATTTAAASAGSLVGTWTGEYTQTKPSYDTGTFELTFAGSAPNYTGTITVAGTCDAGCPITATVSGSTIKVGAIGAASVTYDGTISGKSMAGNYTVGTGQFEGTWEASME